MVNDLIPDNPDPFGRGVAVAARKWERAFVEKCEEIYALQRRLREIEAKGEAYDECEREREQERRGIRTVSELVLALLEHIGLGFAWHEFVDGELVVERLRFAPKILPGAERIERLDDLIALYRREEEIADGT